MFCSVSRSKSCACAAIYRYQCQKNVCTYIHGTLRQALTPSSPSSTGLLSNARGIVITGGTFTEIQGNQYVRGGTCLPIGCWRYHSQNIINHGTADIQAHLNVDQLLTGHINDLDFSDVCLSMSTCGRWLICSSTGSLNLATFNPSVFHGEEIDKPIHLIVEMNRIYCMNTLFTSTITTIKSWLLERTEGNVRCKWVPSQA